MIIVYGPTGVGKTDFVYSLARHLPIEIINMDIGSFYTPLTIGTAKPDLSNTTVPHHLFNILSTPSQFTVANYRRSAFEIVSECKRRGTIPVFVGGSGFYAKSLLYSMSVESVIIPDVDPEKVTWQHLHALDPERAALIHPHDTYRIGRALALCHAGFKSSDFAPQFDPIDDSVVFICLMRERSELYQRIDDRVIQMLSHGWVDEVASLKGTDWEQFIIEKKIIGYDDILHYLDGKVSYSNLITTIQQRTRNYAKRQITLWTGLQREMVKVHDRKVLIDSINLTFADLDLYIKQLLLFIQRMK